jgi:diguanylate cyclase (GGDEF)-like protein
MDFLLEHLVNITAHRDQAMLDLAVISAVHDMAGATSTRVLTIASVRGQQFISVRAVIGGGPARTQEHANPATPGEPVAAVPALLQCLAGRAASAAGVAPDGAPLLWLPIWIDDKAGTCLQVVGAAPFSADAIELIVGIASVYRNFQALLDYSERDSLTGLLNRKTFDDQLARMLRAAAGHKLLPGEPERRGQAGAAQQWLAVIDVDHFKLVNDKFGHVYGDEVLILIANLLQSSFRDYDRVFRFGGEEFVVLLRSTSLQNARKVIERFRDNVARHAFPQVGRVTVSVGFISIDTNDAPVEILGHADQALYYAKSHGRNRSCHYGQLVSEGLLATVASNDTAEFF